MFYYLIKESSNNQIVVDQVGPNGEILNSSELLSSPTNAFINIHSCISGNQPQIRARIKVVDLIYKQTFFLLIVKYEKKKPVFDQVDIKPLTPKERKSYGI